MQAVALDPGFALAYAQASLINSGLSLAGAPVRQMKGRARAQAEEALRLSPDLSEAHLALGVCLFWGDSNYDAALKELEIAAAGAPSNVESLGYIAGIYRRQGRWRESVATYERALSLDPRNHLIAFHAGNNHLFLRNWAAAAAEFHRAIEIAPEFRLPQIGLAYLEVFRNGNPAAARKILQELSFSTDPSQNASYARWDLALLDRDYPAAELIAAGASMEGASQTEETAFFQARLALARGDSEAALRYFTAAALLAEERVRDAPELAERHAELGLIYGYLQRKEDAIRESRRAVELEPENRNAFHGPAYSGNLALVYALVGEPEEAIALIERLLTVPGAVNCPFSPNNITLADLRLRPEWDSLRSNPRFQKILAGPEPKTVY